MNFVNNFFFIFSILFSVIYSVDLELDHSKKIDELIAKFDIHDEPLFKEILPASYIGAIDSDLLESLERIRVHYKIASSNNSFWEENGNLIFDADIRIRSDCLTRTCRAKAVPDFFRSRAKDGYINDFEIFSRSGDTPGALVILMAIARLKCVNPRIKRVFLGTSYAAGKNSVVIERLGGERIGKTSCDGLLYRIDLRYNA